MTTDEVLAALVAYKYIILAGFLGDSRVDRWAQGISDVELRKEINATLSGFDKKFSTCLDALDEGRDLSEVRSVSDLFYEAVVGVPLTAVYKDCLPAKLARHDSACPRPALVRKHSVIEIEAGFKTQPRRVRKEALGPMRQLFKDFPAIKEFLAVNLLRLKNIAKLYNEKLKEAQKILRRELETSRIELRNETASEGDGSDYGGATQSPEVAVELPSKVLVVNERYSAKRRHDPETSQERILRPRTLDSSASVSEEAKKPLFPKKLVRHHASFFVEKDREPVARKKLVRRNGSSHPRVSGSLSREFTLFERELSEEKQAVTKHSKKNPGVLRS